MFKKMKKKALKRLGVLSPSDTQLEQEGVYDDGIAAIRSYFEEERPQSDAQLLSPYNTTLHQDDIVDAERLKVREQLYAEFDKLLDPNFDTLTDETLEVSQPHQHIWFATSIKQGMVFQKCFCEKYRYISQAEFAAEQQRQALKNLQPVCHHRYRRKDGKLFPDKIVFKCVKCETEYTFDRKMWEALLKGHIKL